MSVLENRLTQLNYAPLQLGGEALVASESEGANNRVGFILWLPNHLALFLFSADKYLVLMWFHIGEQLAYGNRLQHKDVPT